MIPWGADWPDNVWLGTTVETQKWAAARIPHLLQHNARVVFLSCEPLLGPIDLTKWFSDGKDTVGIDWVIAGGESGHHARPVNPDWVRSLRDQCINGGVGFHFKQWGNWQPTNDHVNGYPVRQLSGTSGAHTMINVGKKLAGRTLDGKEWDGLPWHV
jgi:protein gp37